jgi:hypothetical protein
MLNPAEYLVRAEAADVVAAAMQNQEQRAHYVELAIHWRTLWTFTARTEACRPGGASPL